MTEMSDRVVIGEFDAKFPKSEGVLGVPDPPKIGFEKKTPDLAFLGSSLTILKFWADFINGKKLGPKMSTGGGVYSTPPHPLVTGKWKYAL